MNDRGRIESMKAAAEFVIALDEAEVLEEKDKQEFEVGANAMLTSENDDDEEAQVLVQTTSSQHNEGSPVSSVDDNNEVVQTLLAETTTSSSQDNEGSPVSSVDNNNEEVQTAYVPRPPVETESPGAFAVYGPGARNESDTVTSSDEDEELAETPIQAEARIVDETAERERLEQEIINDAPRADVLADKKRRAWLGVLGIVLFCGVLVLALGLGLGLSNRSNQLNAASSEDECARAVPVDSLPFTHSGNIGRNSTLMESEALDCFTLDRQDRGNWYLVQGTDSCVSASAKGNEFDAVLSVYQGDCNELSCLHTNTGSPMSHVFWRSTRRSYYVLVSGLNAQVGSYQLEIEGYECVENDSCEGASHIDSLPFAGVGTTEQSTPKTSDTTQCSDSELDAPRGLFYELIGTGACVTASVTEADFPTVLYAYEGSCGELSCKAHEVDLSFPSDANSKITWTSQVGATYRILVAGYRGSGGSFNMSVTENECDKCSSAITVGQFPFSDEGNTGFALEIEDEALQPQCPLIQGGYKGVWYSLRAGTECITASTERSAFDFDTVVAVYQGDDCRSLSCVGENDNRMHCEESCRGSSITWVPSSEGEVFKVLVTGKSEAVGDYGLDVSEKQCDRCLHAIAIDALPYFSSFNNKFARTVEPNAVEECHVIQSEHRGVWYKLHNLGTGSCIVASTSGSELDTSLAIYDTVLRFNVGGCESLKCLNSNNNLPPALDRNESDALSSQVFWKGEVGTEDSPRDYFLFVGGSTGLVGNYQLSVNEYDCLGNDECSRAASVDTLPYLFSGTTINATPDRRSGTLVCSNVEPETRGVWHEVTGSGLCISASVVTDYNDLLAVYEGDCGDLVCLTNDVNRRVDFTLGYSKVTWMSNNGTVYRILVAGFEDIVGNYNLSITECIEPNECFVAREIDTIPFEETVDLNGTTLSVTDWSIAKSCKLFDWYGRFGHAFWYRMTGTGSCISVSTAQSDFNTSVGIYQGDCYDLTCVTDSQNVASDGNSRAVWRSDAGTSYAILVAGLDNQVGPLSIDITEYLCLPNDECEGATAVDALPYSVSGSTRDATPERTEAVACIEKYEGWDDDYFDTWTPELLESRGIWYRAVGSLGPCLNATVSSTSFRAGAAIYEGECNALTCVGVAEGGVAWNSSGAETTYFILVVGNHDSTGDFDLTIALC